MLQELQNQMFRLGIITSKNRTEYANDFLPFQLSEYFDTIICVEDAALPKPSPEPMFEYMKRTGADISNVLFIGDSIYDFQCASSSGVDFGLALWGYKCTKQINANYFFNASGCFIYVLNTNPTSFH